MKYKKKVWLTWHFQTRSRNLSKIFDVDLYEYFRNKNLLDRHLLSSFWTIGVLIKVRPKVIIIQYSFLLLLIVAIYKKIMFNKILLVVDCHTKALRRKASGILSSLFWNVKRWSFKVADLTIISNDGLIGDVLQLNNNYVILPDKIPEEIFSRQKSKKEKYCVYISTFAVDEPFEEVLEASKLLENKFKFYWTGKYFEKVKKMETHYTNVKFTGYLSFEDYYNLIGNADCLLALTTEEDCLQSGAYEALNMEVPFVISKTVALKNFFQTAAVYTNHNPKDIADAIIYAENNRANIVRNIIDLKMTKEKEFNEIVSGIKKLIIQLDREV